MTAIDNAKAHADHLRQLYTRYQEARLHSDRLCGQVEEEAREQVLSVEVRTGWHDPSDPPSQPEEGCLLLSTGGPALRLLVDLDGDTEPYQCRLQHQDWGTPWIDMPLSEADDEALCWFASLFHFAVPQ
jgi:hypothetical protein